MKPKKTILGLPNGSLLEPTLRLLEKVGITVGMGGRSFRAPVQGTSMFTQALIVRPQVMPDAVDRGIVSAGICGLDCVEEAELADRLVLVAELSYSKTTSSPVRVVIFGATKRLRDAADVRVCAEYPVLARRFFRRATIRFSHGTTEAMVVCGAYKYGVGVVESGRSLADNGLTVLRELLVSPTVLIAKRSSPKIEYFGRLLRAGLEAEQYRLLKLDSGAASKEAILALLPAIQAPTVSPLADGGYAFEAVVRKGEAPDLMFRLRQAGAKGIVLQEVKVIL